MPEFDNKDYERILPREAIRVKAEIMHDERWHHCVITNFSAAGARLYSGLKASCDTPVSIKIGEFGQFKATVVWCDGNELGVKFDHDQSEMTHVLKGLVSK